MCVCVYVRACVCVFVSVRVCVFFYRCERKRKEYEVWEDFVSLINIRPDYTTVH